MNEIEKQPATCSEQRQNREESLEVVESPCTRRCALAEDLTHCTECGRTTEQLKFWLQMSDEEKEHALRDAEGRKKE
jgi:predicted Fe-S protein YdhL (DUF1289 family)